MTGCTPERSGHRLGLLAGPIRQKFLLHLQLVKREPNPNPGLIFKEVPHLCMLLYR